MANQLRDPRHESIRSFLRIAGPVILLIGIGCCIVAFVDFFQAGLGRQPRLFWLFFVGMPLMFVGGSLSIFGFMGPVARYQAGEMAPVGRDVVNYMADETQQAVHTMARAAGSGIAAGLAEGQQQSAGICPQCGRAGSADDKFCAGCGAPRTTASYD